MERVAHPSQQPTMTWLHFPHSDRLQGQEAAAAVGELLAWVGVDGAALTTQAAAATMHTAEAVIITLTLVVSTHSPPHTHTS